MAKLTVAQRRAIQSALSCAMRAQRFIDKDEIAVARRGSFASTTLHYTRKDGATLYEITKDIGSDLVGLRQAISQLQQLLEAT